MQLFTLSLLSFILSQDEWEHWRKKKLSSQVKKRNLGLSHVALTTPKISPEELTLTVAELQQLPNNEEADSTEKHSSLNWTIYNCIKKICVNVKTDTDKLNIVVYRYRNSLYLTNKEIDMKLTE